MSSKSLVLPCLRGAIGDWVYYSTVMPFDQLYRIDTHHQIKEDVELDRRVQRDLSNRTEDIKKYLLNENERFFNTIIVGLYGESPDWFSLNLDVLAEKYKLKIAKVEDSLGVLKLNGKEILFSIDGQHRIEAIKKAIAEDSNRFKDDEVSVIFVGHSKDEKGYVRTRKLFATINREAKQPNDNDLAIIDETYAYNIVARMVYARYSKLKKLILLTNTYQFERDDHTHFTNLLAIVTATKTLYKLAKYKDNKYSSPTYEQREQVYNTVEKFFDFIFDNVSDYKAFITKKKKLATFRNDKKGEPLNVLFLPIGLKLISQLYVHFALNDELEYFKSKINLINFDLYNGHFKNILFVPTQNKLYTGKITLAKNLSLYLLNQHLNISDEQLKKDLAKALNINELSAEYKKLELPKRL